MIKPYGSDRLVNCVMSEKEAQELENRSDGMISVVCDEFIMTECQRIADGSFTPIDGFCKKAEMDMVVKKSKLLSGTFFPIPIFFQISETHAKTIQRDALLQRVGVGREETIILRDEQDRIIGKIEDAECFVYDLDRLSQFIFGTNDPKHPGVDKLFSNGDLFIGGKIKIKQIKNEFSSYCLSPEATRAKIQSRGWKSCVGFQTRNVPHLAHEYLQKTAMEVFDGVLIHPVIGWKKKNDYLPEVVMGSYQYLTEHIYPRTKAMLSGLQIHMRYAGPKEAILHAVIRQNYGCSHFIVGRDHAGVGSYYGRYEAHEMVDRYQEFLDIQILKMKGPTYCSKCEAIVTEHVCTHDETCISEVSGTIIREKILMGEYPPKEFIRQEIVDEIMKYDRIFEN